MRFAYEAIRPDGSTVTQQIEAADHAAAVEGLREEGLIVLRLAKKTDGAPAYLGSWLLPRRSKMSKRDLILFTRQMKMLLEAGTPLVPALTAADEQSSKPAVRALLRRLCERVAEGDTLSAALQAEHQSFDPVFRSMVAAGEATATLPDAFGRLCTLAQQQQRTRKLIVNALTYPVILAVLLLGVVAVLLLFVVPRFKMLFTSLRSPLPLTTELLFAATLRLTHAWPFLLGGTLVVAAAVTVGLRLPSIRSRLDELVLKLPLVGPLVGRVIFGRVVRIWAAMLRCHVPLLETIRQSRNAITNAAFLRLLAHVEQNVSSGRRMGQAIAAVGLADPVIVSAIRTGEDNGRLAEATDFVSDWVDEDNAQTIQHAARLAEPVLLALMGVIVGLVAMALFIPLFDLATAAG